MKKISITIAVLLAISGCATHRPIVDNQGVDPVAYERDLRDCQAYAEQISPAGHAVAGAVIGAGLSFALSAIFGGDRGMSAGAGALLGGATGVGDGAEAQINIINRCLHGRGYRVLG